VNASEKDGRFVLILLPWALHKGVAAKAAAARKEPKAA